MKYMTNILKIHHKYLPKTIFYIHEQILKLSRFFKKHEHTLNLQEQFLLTCTKKIVMLFLPSYIIKLVKYFLT